MTNCGASAGVEPASGSTRESGPRENMPDLDDVLRVLSLIFDHPDRTSERVHAVVAQRAYRKAAW
jgi:hypothetical protein